MSATSCEVSAVLPTLYHGCGPRVDGSKVHMFGTKKQAQAGARAIGWPAKCAMKVHTRFAIQWVLSAGIEGGFLSSERYGELYRDRNGATA